jgi:hypothetical protein
MFCPKCSTENLLDQKYCRQCGLQLANVRLSLEGRLDEAAEKVKKGEESIASGLLILGIFFFIAIVSVSLAVVLGKGAFFSGALNLILGLIFGLPAILAGLSRIRSANRLLNPHQAKASLPGPAKPGVLLPPAPDTDPSIATLQQPDSITEHTTYELKQ